MENLKAQIFDKLSQIPLIDVHTHIDGSHLSARGIQDVVLYHMVISDLYSAGCPDGARMSENPTEEEVEFRMTRALPYFKYIQNTSCCWGMKMILKDLYGWEQPITEDNWRELHQIIKDKYADATWSRKVLNKAGIKRICTELVRDKDGKSSDVLQYALEWAFFTRNQWGQFDTALIELEYAWSMGEPGLPLPVTLDRSKLQLSKTIQSLADVKTAVQFYCSKIPQDRILSIASHISTDIQYRLVTDAEMEKALQNRANAGETERDIYANYINEMYLTEFEKLNSKVTLQFSLGAEPLPFETMSKLNPDTISGIAAMFARHPKINFSIFLSCEHQDQAMCTLCRELPNVSLAGYWWHSFFPSSIRKTMKNRLDMLATNKQFGFFSDAYCVEWAYAKAHIVRKQLASVLAGKVEQGQYTLEQALDIAKQILFETAQVTLGMVPAEF